MKRVRDRVIAIGAALVLVALAIVVVALVLGAQDTGISTREDLRLEQARALAASMDTRVQGAFTSIGGIYSAPGAWRMGVGDPTDAAKLAPQDPEARTGTLLVNADKVLVNGSLLRDPSQIGKPYDREGLDRVLAGDAALMPAGPGVTTTRPTIAIAAPARDAAGSIVGAVVLEIEIAPDSAFNQEVSQLRAGRTGGFSFVDETGVVIASSNEALLGKPLSDKVTKGFPNGFHRGGGKVAAIADVPSANWKL
ncbi:MAG: Cache domain, partial [Actinomycetota bacterium]